MLTSVSTEMHSLGTEPFESLGFESCKSLEEALAPLMEEIKKDDA